MVLHVWWRHWELHGAPPPPLGPPRPPSCRRRGPQPPRTHRTLPSCRRRRRRAGPTAHAAAPPSPACPRSHCRHLQSADSRASDRGAATALRRGLAFTAWPALTSQPAPCKTPVRDSRSAGLFSSVRQLVYIVCSRAFDFKHRWASSLPLERCNHLSIADMSRMLPMGYAVSLWLMTIYVLYALLTIF